MIRYMLETNTVSLLLRQHPEVQRRVLAAPMAALRLSVITEAELLFGLAKRPAARRLALAVRELLRRVEVVAWERSAAARYGALRAGLERNGRTLAPLDLLIAAHALDRQAVLVTNDRAFEMVPGLELADWTVPDPAH